MTNRTGARVTTAFVTLLGVAAGAWFALLSSVLYAARGRIVTGAMIVGGLSGAIAGWFWSRRMIPRQKKSEHACFGAGSGFGVTLGAASGVIVHIALGLASILWPSRPRTPDFVTSPASVGSWLAGPLPVGIIFGVVVGLVAGLISSVVLVLAVRPEGPFEGT